MANDIPMPEEDALAALTTKLAETTQLLLNIEYERDAARAALERETRKNAGIKADQHAAALSVVAAFKFASDESIRLWAEALPDEKTQEIGRLTRMLAREQARVMEMGAAHTALLERLKTRRAAMTEEEFDGAWPA